MIAFPFLLRIEKLALMATEVASRGHEFPYSSSIALLAGRYDSEKSFYFSGQSGLHERIDDLEAKVKS